MLIAANNDFYSRIVRNLLSSSSRLVSGKQLKKRIRDFPELTTFFLYLYRYITNSSSFVAPRATFIRNLLYAGISSLRNSLVRIRSRENETSFCTYFFLPVRSIMIIEYGNFYVVHYFYVNIIRMFEVCGVFCLYFDVLYWKGVLLLVGVIEK